MTELKITAKCIDCWKLQVLTDEQVAEARLVGMPFCACGGVAVVHEVEAVLR